MEECFSPEQRAAMRTASRSPNKRGSEREPQSVAPAAATAAPLLALATPFKRVRVSALISPTKSGVDALAARRRGFQSLADDCSAVSVKCIPTAAAPDVTDTESAASTQQSSQEQLELRKARECSPADVAELLACAETLEERMDALDVGSFLSWRPPSDARAAASPSSSSSMRHRRKPRIHFADDVSLHDVFGEDTQIVSDEDEEAEPEPPAHFLLDGCCTCSGPDCGADLERSWQVYTPPPRPGFDPTCCSANSDGDGDSDDDTQLTR